MIVNTFQKLKLIKSEKSIQLIRRKGVGGFPPNLALKFWPYQMPGLKLALGQISLQPMLGSC